MFDILFYLSLYKSSSLSLSKSTYITSSPASGASGTSPASCDAAQRCRSAAASGRGPVWFGGPPARKGLEL